MIVLVVAVLVAVALGAACLFLEREADALTKQVASARTLIEQSDGRVAEPATREALVQQVATADQVLAGTAFVERRPGDAAAATEAIVAASDRVWASMVDRARSDIRAGRGELGAALTRARKTYDVTEGLGADPTSRAGVKKSLDAASVTQARTGDGKLAEADLAALEKAAGEIDRRSADLVSATNALITAQDAESCPVPDQLWSPDSGRIPAGKLAVIPWAPEFEVRADVLDSLVALNFEYKARFGTDLTVNSAYRGIESQESLVGNPLAAPPGCSTHGLGLAVDFGGGVETHGSPQYDWLKEHAAAHGWTHPGWAEPDGRLPEPWHWQSVKSPQETL